MAKVYTGKDGSLVLLGDPIRTIAKVINWSLEGQADALDTTTLGDSFRTYEIGLQGFTGSATLLFYAADDGENSASRLLKLAKAGSVDAAGSKIALSFRLGVPGTALGKETVLTPLITSYQYGASVGEIVQASISFTVTGEPNYLV